MTQYYYGREISGDREIKNLKTLSNNPKERKRYIRLGNAINIGTFILLGTVFFGIISLTIWGLIKMFESGGFNIWAIIFNPVFIVFAIVYLGIYAGRTR